MSVQALFLQALMFISNHYQYSSCAPRFPKFPELDEVLAVFFFRAKRFTVDFCCTRSRFSWQTQWSRFLLPQSWRECPNRLHGVKKLLRFFLTYLTILEDIVSFFFSMTFRPVFLGFFLHTTNVFRMVYLCGYNELEGLPHHSSDVFFHGESISDRFASV